MMAMNTPINQPSNKPVLVFVHGYLGCRQGNHARIPVLVFVHGYLGGSQQWACQVEKFSTDFNVITPDLPGFGLKAHLPSPETMTGYAQYMLDQLDQLSIGQFHLVGHSMGGMIAQEIMKLTPARVKKLLLYGTGPLGVMPGRFETIDESRSRVKTDGIIKYYFHARSYSSF